MKKYRSFLSQNFQFLEVKFSLYLNRRVFVMTCTETFFLCGASNIVSIVHVTISNI